LILPDLEQYAFHLGEPTFETRFFDETVFVPQRLVLILGMVNHFFGLNTAHSEPFCFICQPDKPILAFCRFALAFDPHEPYCSILPDFFFLAILHSSHNRDHINTQRNASHYK
jgi:hypothetical protein